MIPSKYYKIKINGVLITICIPLIVGAVLFGFVLEYEKEYDLRDVFLFTTCSFAILTFIMHTVNGEKLNKLKQQKNEDAKQYQNEMLQIAKQTRSYEIISQYYKPEMVESLRAYREIKHAVKLKENPSVEKLKEHLKHNPRDHSRLHLLLNSFENVALQIKNDFIDEAIIKDALHSMCYNTYLTLKSYIKDAQAEKGHENCWDELVKLCRKWGEPK